MLNQFLDVRLLFTLSHVQLFMTPWTAAHQDSLSFTISQSLLKLMSVDIQPSHPLLFLLTEDSVLLPLLKPSWTSVIYQVTYYLSLTQRVLSITLLPCAAAKSLQSCWTLCDPVDGSPPGSPIPGILQASILEWVAISFSRGSFQPRDWTWVSCIAGRLFYHLSHQGSQNCLRWLLKAWYSEHVPQRMWLETL